MDSTTTTAGIRHGNPGRRLGMVIASGAVCLATIAGPKAAHAADDLNSTHAYSATWVWPDGPPSSSYTCSINSKGNVTLRFEQRVWAYGGKIRQVRMKVRLVPTAAGHNWLRSWGTERSTKSFKPTVGFNGSVAAKTPRAAYSSLKAWTIEVKTRFDRNNGRDPVYTDRYVFDVARCDGQENIPGGGSIPAA